MGGQSDGSGLVLGAFHNGRRFGICRIRGTFVMKRLLLILLVAGLWHTPASAKISQWGDTWYNSRAAALAACEAQQLAYLSNGMAAGGCNHVPDPKGNYYRLRGLCGYPGVIYQECYVYLYPDVPCSDGIDTTTGECVAPEEPENECADKAGIEEAFSKAGQAPDSFMTISASGMALPQRQGCKGGCATQVIDNRCKTRVSGSYYCRGLVVYSGEQCSTTGTGDQIGEDTNESTEPEIIKEDVPCIYSASGGKQVCESKKSEEKEGQSCGTVNGVETCIDKAPNKNAVDITTEVTTETNSDGSTATIKKDTATVTKCTGINDCTTTTTTNTTTTNRDANGNVTSVSGKCTGEHCPDKKGDPDGDGDGFGDCVFGGCSEDEFGGGENEDVPGFGESAESFMAKVQSSPLVSAVNGIAFPDGGSCSMTSATTPLGTISGDVVCENTHWLDPLYFVFLAIHALAAVRVLMSA